VAVRSSSRPATCQHRQCVHGPCSRSARQDLTLTHMPNSHVLQIEERKQHQARLLDKLSSIQVPGATTITTSPPRLVSGRRVGGSRAAYGNWACSRQCQAVVRKHRISSSLRRSSNKQR
jgi:hypothetical protein